MLLEAPLYAQSTAYIYHALIPLFGVNNRGALPSGLMNHGLNKGVYLKIGCCGFMGEFKSLAINKSVENDLETPPSFSVIVFQSSQKCSHFNESKTIFIHTIITSANERKRFWE